MCPNQIVTSDLSVKVTMVTQAIYPCALYGTEFIPLGERHLEQLRSQTAEALVGASRCMTPCLVLLLASPRLRDPPLQVILMAISAARRFLATRSCDGVDEFFTCASSFKPKPNCSRGPASTLRAYLARLGWSLGKDGGVFFTGFVRFKLLEIPWPQLLIYADWAWQDRLLTCLTEKHSLSSLPNISRSLTPRALSKFADRDKVLLLREIAGAFLTKAQQATWDATVSGKCDHCSEQDTRAHRVLHCPAFAMVREQFSRVVAHVQECDSSWPLLPVMHEPTWQEFRDGIHQKMPEAQFAPTLQHHLQLLMMHTSRVHVYTDGSCIFPQAPGFRYSSYAVVLDSCLNDEERIAFAQCYKQTGVFPASLHLISHALGTGAQTIHRAELLALVRVMEEFAGVIVHVDSASALRAWECATSWLPGELHPLRDLDLILRLRAIPHLGCNLAVKIKAHLEPCELPDLECYHALGNAMADRGAADALKLLPALTNDWHRQYQEAEEELSLLQEWMAYLVALQPVRIRLAQTTVDEGLPVVSSASVADRQQTFREWNPSPFWTPAVHEAGSPVFWCYGVWGEEISEMTARWLSTLRWPQEDCEVHPGQVGLSWLEITLSLLLWLKAFPPVRRRQHDASFALCAFDSYTVAVAEGLTLSELSLQCSTLVSQVAALSIHPLTPDWNARARVRSLYLQGFNMHAFGWKFRPKVPNQEQVQTALETLRKLKPHATCWSWLPAELFADFGGFSAPADGLTWKERQSRLQEGLKAVRVARASSCA